MSIESGLKQLHRYTLSSLPINLTIFSGSKLNSKEVSLFLYFPNVFGDEQKILTATAIETGKLKIWTEDRYLRIFLHYIASNASSVFFVSLFRSNFVHENRYSALIKLFFIINSALTNNGVKMGGLG